MQRTPHSTIFVFSSLGNVVLTGGAAILLLLVVVRPEASVGLSAIERTLYWGLHVSSGIVALYAASLLMRRAHSFQVPTMVSVLICGVVGTLLIAPVFVLIETIWPTVATQEVDDVIDRLASHGLIGKVLAEFLEALPWVMSCWLLLNLPLWLGSLGTDRTEDLTMDDSVQSLPPNQPQPPEDEASRDCLSSAVKDNLAPVTVEASTKPDTAAPSVVSVQSTEHSGGVKFLESLPGVFGKDVITVGSDLHYLHVHTLAGRTTVLGNLRDVVDELADLGMQVHRSHWVSHEHVQRIVNTGGQTACILSNDLRVPVSRRRWKAVRDYYGKGVVQRTPSKNE